MTLITRSIHNLSATQTLSIFVPGYSTEVGPISLAPSTTLDLLTIVTEDTLEGMQTELVRLVAGGLISVISTIDTATFADGYTGAASWGAITGTLSAQTDLQTALNTKLPLAGGTLTGNLTLSDNAADPTITFSTNSATSTISMNHSGNADLILLNGGAGLTISHASGQIVVDALALIMGGNPIRSTTGDISIGGFDVSAILNATSTTRGFLPPRMTTTQKDAIATPATGLVVYDSTLNKLSVWTGAAWETVTSS